MMRHWQKLLNTDCEVYQIGEYYVYPIFRNGSSSLEEECDNILTNDSIKYCDNIHVLIRDPVQRFQSGLNQYCKVYHDLDVLETFDKVKKGELIDRHFSPQWTWLLHLYKYYKGKVCLRDFDNLKDYTDIHVNPTTHEVTQVEAPDEFVAGDRELFKHFDQFKDLSEIIKEHINVLS